MARYFRRSYRRYSRSGARGRYRRSRYSYGRRTASKYRNTRSARQMTQNGLYQIVCTETNSLTFTSVAVEGNNKYFAFSLEDLGPTLIENTMYKNLTNVFDQVRIERIGIKITPLGNDLATANAQQFTLFTCVDRNGFRPEITLPQIRSYQSYKSTIYGSSSSNKIPNHYVSIDFNTLVEKSAYYTSKQTPPTAHYLVGVEAAYETAVTKQVFFNVEITYDVRFRGVRLDTGAISATVSAIN